MSGSKSSVRLAFLRDGRSSQYQNNPTAMWRLVVFNNVKIKTVRPSGALARRLFKSIKYSNCQLAVGPCPSDSPTNLVKQTSPRRGPCFVLDMSAYLSTTSQFHSICSVWDLRVRPATSLICEANIWRSDGVQVRSPHAATSFVLHLSIFAAR